MVRLPVSSSKLPGSSTIHPGVGRGATAARRLGFCSRSRIFLSVRVHLALISLLLVPPAFAQTPVANGLSVRPCKVGEGAPAAKKPAKPKRHPEPRTDLANACLEVRSTSLGVQEHLQSYVRRQRWHVGDEDVTESLWNFSLELTPEDLLNYAKLDSTTQRIDWKSGKASVRVTTAEIGDGYTRTTVSASFEGFGNPEDKFALQRVSWKLASSGRLEAALISALQEHSAATTARPIGLATLGTESDAAQEFPSGVLFSKYPACVQHPL